MLSPDNCANNPEHKNFNLRLIDCITWAMRSGLIIRFYTERKNNQFFYCCTLESRIGIKSKTYEIKELTLYGVLYHIEKHYGNIFSELSCPPWPRANTLG